MKRTTRVSGSVRKDIRSRPTTWMERMYESMTPVFAGEMLKRMPTVSIAAARVNSVPRRSIRVPSHR